LSRSAALVVHSGGPTAVINASLAGVVDEARTHPEVAAVLGARSGIDGVIGDDFVDLSALSAEVLSAVAKASSSALGTSRRPMSEADFERVLAVCERRRIRFLFYTGGNGSMATAHEIAVRARDRGQALAVLGVPKTIDNDLAVTDHSPGYGSAARFFASAARDIGADNRALPQQVQVLEVLGRHAGWIAAATMLARQRDDDPPHLVYVPERPLPLQRLLDDVQRVYDRLKCCLVVVCEGQLDEHGQPFGADARPTSRGLLAMNLAHHLSSLITEHLGLKARGEKPGLLGRVSAELRSEVDRREARLCGQTAVRAAVEGASDVMITLERAPGPSYVVNTGLVPLDRVALVERPLPSEWIDDRGRVSPAFLEYAAPLVGPIERNVYLS
jgi:ATP-dependent phosphofructokinase / diphosphate-dependent phosphofructokinase